MSNFSVADEYPKTSWPNSSTPAWLWMRTTASVSLTSVPSFSKRTRFKIRSKIAASSESAPFVGFDGEDEDEAACAEASAVINKNRETISSIAPAAREKQLDILQFFYAVRRAKSNHPMIVEGHGFCRAITAVNHSGFSRWERRRVRKSLAIPVLSCLY